MPKFRFSLEVLLKHREDLEQREKDSLMKAVYSYQLALRHRDSLEEKRRETIRKLSRTEAESPEAGELQWFRLYLNRLTHEIEKCKREIKKLDSRVREQKKAVIEAVKKRKVISTLKTKKQKEFNIALDKKELKEVEEWIATRYAAGRQSLQHQLP